MRNVHLGQVESPGGKGGAARGAKHLVGNINININDLNINIIIVAINNIIGIYQQSKRVFVSPHLSAYLSASDCLLGKMSFLIICCQYPLQKI